MFHGQFFVYFHGRKKKFTDGNPKNDKNFHGRHFDFHGEKKTLPFYKGMQIIQVAVDFLIVRKCL